MRLEPPGSETDSESQSVSKRHCTSKETDTTAASKLTHSKSAMYKTDCNIGQIGKKSGFGLTMISQRVECFAPYVSVLGSHLLAMKGLG